MSITSIHLSNQNSKIYEKFPHIHIHIPSQTLKMYARNYWKNTLINMLTCLEKKANYIFIKPQLDLFLVHDKDIALYNKKYMDCVGPTNILSFPSADQEKDNDDEKLPEKEIKTGKKSGKKTQNTTYTDYTDNSKSAVTMSNIGKLNQSIQNPFAKYAHTKKTDTSWREQTIYITNLGSLVLSINTLEREARLFGQNPHEHAIRLLAHGLVHLLGFDHGEHMQELTDLLEENNQTQENMLKNNLETFIPFWSYYHG